MSNTELNPEIQELWNTVQIEMDGSVPQFDATICPDIDSPHFSLGVGALPALQSVNWSAEQPELELGGILGKGGMGIVRVAKQSSLARDVAVKSLHASNEGTKDDRREATLKLMQEAWAMGLLEHPNIVPVHLLGRDRDGKPILVMKRIEGVAWRDVIAGEAEMPSGFQGSDPLVWHIEILLQVCNAMQFAHTKGLLHRDLKPENVMIGEFGEVYVMDWGLAVRLREDVPTNLPLARDTKGIAGTPAYMAPEMTKGVGRWLTEATDLYLLGTCLHEAITGMPRHIGHNIFQLLASSHLSEPYDYEDKIPRELADILNKAMHVEPESRFESVEAFRKALVEFLQHKNSVEIGREATARLQELQEITSSPVSVQEKNTLQIHELYGQCRFGFQEALRSWPQNTDAQEGLQSTLEIMAEYSIRQGEYLAASALVAQLPRENEALQKKLAELKDKMDSEAARNQQLQKIAENLNLRVGSKTRSILISLIGVCWCVFFFVMGWLSRNGYYEPSNFDYVFANISIAALLGLGVFFGRRVLFQNAANRSLVRLVYLAFACFILLGITGQVLGFSGRDSYIIALLIICLITGMMTIFLDWRLVGAPLVFFLALVASLIRPDYSYEFQGAADLVAFVWIGVVWRNWNMMLFESPSHKN